MPMLQRTRTLIVFPLLVTVTAVLPARVQADAPPGGAPADRRQALADARPRAIEQVLTSARSDDPFLRANAIEAAQSLPGRALPLVQLALDDEHPAVRFAALVTVGQLRFNAAVPAATRLRDDPVESVRAAALFALHQCGQQVDITPLAQALAGQSPSARGNAAMLLGMMDDPSAAPMLMELARVSMPKVASVQEAIVRIQVAEAVLKLTEDEVALSALRAGAFSQFDEVRVLAVLALGKIGDRRMKPAIARMLEDPPIELQLAAAEYLARLGDFEGLSVALEATGSTLFTVRAQAAMALALFGDVRASEALGRLLADPDEHVRVAAAAAVLRAAPPEAAAGGTAAAG
ncbi:MAG: HEAT repeat domain-containing protein [Phycisphaeraceae bacterium]